MNNSERRAAERIRKQMERSSAPKIEDAGTAATTDSSLEAARRKALRFQEVVARYVRRYSPDDLVPALASKMDEVRRNPQLLSTWPPHFLMHAMAASCAYHRYSGPLRRPTLPGLINIYHDYREPIIEYYLSKGRSLYLFFVYVARQQHYLQVDANLQDAGRCLLLFDEHHYPETLSLMRQRFGIGFDEWRRFCVALWAGFEHRNLASIDDTYFLNSTGQIVSRAQLPTLFDLMTTTSDAVGEEYMNLRAERGKVLYDPALPSPFVRRPLFRLTDGRYVAVHKPLVFFRGFEGPYDLAQEFRFEPFGKEFGKAFERYVGTVLGHLSNVQIYTEADMQQQIGIEAQVCDFVVVGDDFVWFVECKAVKYSAILSSENAIRRDTSTTRIAEGIDQLYSTIRLMHTERLQPLIGITSGKDCIASVVTFRPLHAANDDDYWREVLAPQVTEPDAVHWQTRFAFKPQIMAIAGLERFVLVANKETASPLALFREKLAQQYLVVGDWEIYLGKRLGGDDVFSMWHGAFDSFFADIFTRLGGPRLG